MERRIWTTRLVMLIGVALLSVSVLSAAVRSSVTWGLPSLPALAALPDLPTERTMSVQPAAAQRPVPPPAQPKALLSDDFTADNPGANPPAGWSIADGKWDGVVADGRRVLRHGQGAYGHVVAGSAAWTNYSVGVQIRPTAVADGFAGVIARYRDRGDYYACGMYTANVVRLWRVRAGAVTTLDQRQALMDTHTFHDVGLVVDGTRLSCVVDGRFLLAATDSTFQAGAIGLVAAAGDTSEFANVRVMG